MSSIPPHVAPNDMERTLSMSTEATIVPDTHLAPHAQHTHRHRTPSPVPPVPAPDVVSFFDPASAGGGGPLVRIATARSERERQRRAEALGMTSVPDGSVAPGEKKADDEVATSTAGQGKAASIDEKNLAANDEEAKPDDTCDECASATADAEEHVYPDGGYGWVVVVCCLTLSALTNGWGMNYGVWQQYYADSPQYSHYPNAVVALIGSLQGLTINMMAFIGGRVGDQFGFKRVLIIGAVICWVSLFSAAFSHNLAALIITQGLLLGAGQGMIVPLFMSLPSQWFFKRRGLASGITLGGAGLGGGVSTLVVRRLLTAVGGQKTLLIYSFINLVFMAIAIALIRTRPHSPEAQATRGPWINRAVLSRSEFWAIALSLFVGVIGYGGPFVFLPQWMSLRFPNLSAGQVTVPLTIMGFTVCVGRSGVGLVADYIGPMNTYILVLVLSGVTQYALWLTAKSFAAACVFGLMYGLVAPGYLGLLPQIVVTVFGPAALASNVGLLLLFAGPGMVVSAALGGAMFDATGRTDMKYMIVVMGGMQIFAGVLACWARVKASRAVWAKI